MGGEHRERPSRRADGSALAASASAGVITPRAAATVEHAVAGAAGGLGEAVGPARLRRLRQRDHGCYSRS